MTPLHTKTPAYPHLPFDDKNIAQPFPLFYPEMIDWFFAWKKQDNTYRLKNDNN